MINRRFCLSSLENDFNVSENFCDDENNSWGTRIEQVLISYIPILSKQVSFLSVKVLYRLAGDQISTLRK
jgi:hypothetical protein